LVPPFTGHFRVLIDTPRGLAPLHPGTRAPDAPTPTTELRRDIVQKGPGSNSETKLTSATATALIHQEENGVGGEEVKIKPCGTCGSDATSVRYNSISSRGDFSVCATCYMEGRFPSTMHSGEFIKVSNQDSIYHSGSGLNGLGTTKESNEWSDEEVLKLLEGLEMFENDWDKISDHVGTRAKDQCIVHFLQLPIEDPYLEATQADLGPLQYAARLPFSQVDNPIMSVMAFLASTVNVNVAAKAAGRAVEELEKSMKSKVTSSSEEGGASEDSKGKGKAVDEMEVDDTTTEEVMKGEKDDHDSPRNNIERAAAIALGSAAAKSHVLALEEDASLHSLVTAVVEAQVQKLELKLAHFTQLETLLELERRSIEANKESLYQERLRMNKMMVEVQEIYSNAKLRAELSELENKAMQTLVNATTRVEEPVIVVQEQGEMVQEQNMENYLALL
jgi:SWI/SNF related-matrix-associated actin-dependent regulator of chromatin subfamily C